MFRRFRLALLLVIASLAASGPSLAGGVGAEPAPAGLGEEPTLEPEREPVSHVLTVADDSVTSGQLRGAVDDAGGTVVDVIEPLGAALVEAEPGEFLDEVMARDDIVGGGARNLAVGAAPEATTPPDTLPAWGVQRDDAAQLSTDDRAASSPAGPSSAAGVAATAQMPGSDPLEGLQWGNTMVGATVDAAHDVATGQGVTVAVIDTGVDGDHPDLAANVDLARSRDVARQADEVAEDPLGHGTHVAGIVGAARDGVGVAGVAPDVDLINLRAASDSGYFFAYQVSSAIVAAADRGADVAVMSFYTDPWLYNCTSVDDYISGEASEDDIAEQSLTRELMLGALDYAHANGVTLVAAAGNQHVDLTAEARQDAGSPSFPLGAAEPRTVTSNCLDLPSEAPQVLSVSAVGPSGTKADYSNYGAGSIAVAGPGGWHRDLVGTASYQSPENLVLSTYPLDVAQRTGLADGDGQPVDAFSRRSCEDDDVAAGCGFYTYLQGTSMAAPYVAGVAALIVERHGEGSGEGGYTLAPDRVHEVLLSTAAARPCPEGGVADYGAAGRPESWNAVCEGGADDNSFYGRGIVDASAAVN